MTKIHVVESILKANDAVAAQNRARLESNHVLALNIMSAPGSGKTTLLEKTIAKIESSSAVLVGDLQTTRDADRLSDAAIECVQINTGRGCHLSATQVSAGLDALHLDKVSYLFIENVGNMVCPASHDLGEDLRVVLLSTPEGDDKVAKYPTLFQGADLVIVNKMDLAELLEFDMNTVRDDLAKINSAVEILQISTKSEAGLSDWIDWLLKQTKRSSDRG